MELKRQAKKSIGLPTDSIAILTVGSRFKFLPANSLDFVEVARGILQQVPNAFLLAVGFDADSRWSLASLGVGSRIRTLGTVSQAQLGRIHQATDIYIEGFPFGTTGSLLEAGIKGIPAVLAPLQCPPPYGSDGVALDESLYRPRTLEEYEAMIIRLSGNPEERALQGKKLRAAVAKHHTGAGWQQYLEEAIKVSPLEHEVYPAFEPVRTPTAIHEHWSAFVPKFGQSYEDAIENAISKTLAEGVRPRLTTRMQRVCREYRKLRHRRGIPLPLLVLFCNYLLPFSPIGCARWTFRLLVFLCRGSLVSRLPLRVAQLFFGKDRPLGAYEEYRVMRDSEEFSTTRSP
jgi:hypothetical protein